jgi:hypothetical protein
LLFSLLLLGACTVGTSFIAVAGNIPQVVNIMRKVTGV